MTSVRPHEAFVTSAAACFFVVVVVVIYVWVCVHKVINMKKGKKVGSIKLKSIKRAFYGIWCLNSLYLGIIFKICLGVSYYLQAHDNNAMYDTNKQKIIISPELMSSYFLFVYLSFFVWHKWKNIVELNNKEQIQTHT